MMTKNMMMINKSVLLYVTFRIHFMYKACESNAK